MKFSINRCRSLVFLMAFGLLALSACAPRVRPTPRVDNDDIENTRIANQIYKGVRREALDAHSATFHAEFTPADGSAGWTYDGTLNQSGPNLRRDLRMEGLPANVDPGDVTLIAADGSQYMIGEAVGVSRCLLFPESVDLDDSFLTPDSFLPPINVPDSALDEAGEETVAGQEGTLYNLQSATVGDLTNATGSIVIAENGAVLRSTNEGDMVDNLLLNGVAGRIQWEYVVTAVGAADPVNVPPECVVDLPVMADATELARLPNLIQYETVSTLAEIQAFYEQEMAVQGWGVYEFPQVRDEATVLTYAREGVILSVSVEDEGDHRVVQLFTEDR